MVGVTSSLRFQDVIVHHGAGGETFPTVIFPVATFDRVESDRPNHQSPITPWLGMRNEKRVISLSEEAVSQPWCALAISEAI